MGTNTGMVTDTLPTLCGCLGFSIDDEYICVTFEYTGHYYKFKRKEKEVSVENDRLVIEGITILTETDLTKAIDLFDKVMVFSDDNIFLLTSDFFDMAKEMAYTVDSIKLDSEQDDGEVYVDYNKLTGLLDEYSRRLKNTSRHLLHK